jgi:hypothetical protein
MPTVIAISRVMVAAAMLAATASMSSASTLGLDVTSNKQVLPQGEWDNAGWQFSVSAPITVDGLGIFDVYPTGLVLSYQVGLWDNNGTQLAQTTVSSASTPVASASAAGDWLFENIGPIVLQPGIYVIGGYYHSGEELIMAADTIATAPQITFLTSRMSTNGKFAEPGTFALPWNGVFGPNFRIQTPPAIPEPASLVLVFSGLGGLRLVRWRR